MFHIFCIFVSGEILFCRSLGWRGVRGFEGEGRVGERTMRHLKVERMLVARAKRRCAPLAHIKCFISMLM